MKDFTNVHCCLDCNHFCFWDDDYCCTWNMTILQHGFFMNEDIDKNMKSADNCKDWQYDNRQNFFIDEYRKYRQLKQEKELLASFVNNKWK